MRDQQMRILVLDDEDALRGALVEGLRQAGMEVVGTATTLEAIHLLREWVPDVLLSDVHVPDGGARALIDYIATLSVAPRVIIMTGSDLEWARGVVAAGRAVRALCKPFGIGEIIEAAGRI